MSISQWQLHMCSFQYFPFTNVLWIQTQVFTLSDKQLIFPMWWVCNRIDSTIPGLKVHLILKRQSCVRRTQELMRNFRIWNRWPDDTRRPSHFVSLLINFVYQVRLVTYWPARLSLFVVLSCKLLLDFSPSDKEQYDTQCLY